MFVIGDASGSAKGAVVVYQHGLDYESGTWSEEWRGKSSNVREAESLTDRLEHLAAESDGLAAQVVRQCVGRPRGLCSHRQLGLQGVLLKGPLDEQGAQ